ncbi:hypothetical protein [Cohnella faecalis]|nr:hypothetical protein [Cohnella faecalis]
MYTEAVERLTTLHSLFRKSREYLTGRLNNPEAPMDTESTLEERIGHAWQLAELREYGLVQQDVELVQLAFHSYADEARGEFVDQGYWAGTGSDKVFATRTYRPYRAAKYIKEEDSVFHVVQAKELFIYPGELNPRIRWEEASYREPKPQDCAALKVQALRSVPDAVKLAKNQMKNPLSDKHPVLLLAFRDIAVQEGRYVLTDHQGKQLPLEDSGPIHEATTPLLPLLARDYLENQAMAVMFSHDKSRNRLSAKPLSVITDRDIVRLLF